jgi:hypothetical protein
MIEGSGSGSESESGPIPLINGSGSGRPKNMWIRWIRIRNTAKNSLACTGDGWLSLGRWVAKLGARLLATAALWVQIQTSFKNTKWAT